MLEINKLVYNLVYRFGTPRWDSGAVPPQLVTLVEKTKPRTALDLGCGTGTSAIYLAQRGLKVVGVDFTPQAIATARGKAQRANVNVDFHVGDVTHLDFLIEPFDLVLDIGCFHGLDADGRARYAKHLTRLTHPGSTFLIWGFDQPAFFGKYGATPEQIQRQFAPSFAMTRTEPGAKNGQRVGSWHWLARAPTP